MSNPAQELIGDAYEEYRLALTQFVRRRVRDEADVADIVQESFSRLIRYQDQADLGALKGLLFRIAGNLILLRARSIRNRHSDADIPLTEELELPAANPSPEQEVLGQQQVGRLLEAVKTLSGKCQEVFVLSRFQGMPHAEIAARCGISVKMVEKYISQALKICSEAVGMERP